MTIVWLTLLALVFFTVTNPLAQNWAEGEKWKINFLKFAEFASIVVFISTIMAAMLQPNPFLTPAIHKGYDK